LKSCLSCLRNLIIGRSRGAGGRLLFNGKRKGVAITAVDGRFLHIIMSDEIKNISLRKPVKRVERLKKKAQTDDMTMSAVIRVILTQYFKNLTTKGE
jgi:hypothetical protein